MMPDDQLRESQAMYKQAEKMTPRKKFTGKIRRSLIILYSILVV